MAKFHCKYCGGESNSIQALTSGLCMRHPDGTNKGRHALYEGGEKSEYACRFCGTKSRSLAILTGGLCMRHPDGTNKGRHQPAL